MAGFDLIKTEPTRYQGATISACNLVARHGPDLAEAVCTVMLRWVLDKERKPGSDRVMQSGTQDHDDMVTEVLAEFNYNVSADKIVRCWVDARKSGYKQMRDGVFQLFLDEVKTAARRRRTKRDESKP